MATHGRRSEILSRDSRAKEFESNKLKMKTAPRNTPSLSVLLVLVAIVELLFSAGAEPQEPVALAGNHPLANIQTWGPAAAERQLHLMAVLGLHNTDQPSN
jgi:hypothetical protein